MACCAQKEERSFGAIGLGTPRRWGRCATASWRRWCRPGRGRAGPDAGQPARPPPRAGGGDARAHAAAHGLGLSLPGARRWWSYWRSAQDAFAGVLARLEGHLRSWGSRCWGLGPISQEGPGTTPGHRGGAEAAGHRGPGGEPHRRADGSSTAAFLVAREREAAFDAKVRSLAARFELLTFQYTGPWAPYHFADIRLRREPGQGEPHSFPGCTGRRAARRRARADSAPRGDLDGLVHERVHAAVEPNPARAVLGARVEVALGAARDVRNPSTLSPLRYSTRNTSSSAPPGGSSPRPSTSIAITRQMRSCQLRTNSSGLSGAPCGATVTAPGGLPLTTKVRAFFPCGHREGVVVPLLERVQPAIHEPVRRALEVRQDRRPQQEHLAVLAQRVGAAPGHSPPARPA